MPAERDTAEVHLRRIHTITDQRVDMCPWAAFADPFVSAVVRSHRWWSKGQIREYLGGPTPEALARGLDIYDGAVTATMAHEMRKPPKPPKGEKPTGIPDHLRRPR